jgi:hypothetical protein
MDILYPKTTRLMPKLKENEQMSNQPEDYKKALGLLFSMPQYSSKQIVEKLMEDHPRVFCEVIQKHFPLPSNTVVVTPVVQKAVQQELPVFQKVEKPKKQSRKSSKHTRYTQPQLAYIKEMRDQGLKIKAILTRYNFAFGENRTRAGIAGAVKKVTQ